MDKVSKVKEKVVELWKTHLKVEDFSDEFGVYLKNNTDWHSTDYSIKDQDLTMRLMYSDDDGYDISVKLIKPPNITLKK